MQYDKINLIFPSTIEGGLYFTKSEFFGPIKPFDVLELFNNEYKVKFEYHGQLVKVIHVWKDDRQEILDDLTGKDKVWSSNESYSAENQLLIYINFDKKLVSLQYKRYRSFTSSEIKEIFRMTFDNYVMKGYVH